MPFMPPNYYQVPIAANDDQCIHWDRAHLTVSYVWLVGVFPSRFVPTIPLGVWTWHAGDKNSTPMHNIIMRPGRVKHLERSLSDLRPMLSVQ